MISLYAPCVDITKVVTPDIKRPGRSVLAFIDLSGGHRRLGGSALAQVHGQLGFQCPDVYNAALLARAFSCTQGLIKSSKLLSGHDISDGGFITCLVEMLLSGGAGAVLNAPGGKDSRWQPLFAEELGWLVEIDEECLQDVAAAYQHARVPFMELGPTTCARQLHWNGLQLDVAEMHQWWERTSHEIERLQVNPCCADQEWEKLFKYRVPNFKRTFQPSAACLERPLMSPPRVAVLREEGSNGDREMAAAFFLAGFEVWDITMTDILTRRITSLDIFSGVAFVGGFSYADVLGAAVGWSSIVEHNEHVSKVLSRFKERHDTFSLGVCNGCQVSSPMHTVS